MYNWNRTIQYMLPKYDVGSYVRYYKKCFYKIFKTKKRHTIERESLLLNEIEKLENEIHSITDNLEVVVNKRNKLKEELENIHDGKINGYIIRAKANLIEYNEINSKYFSNLEKIHMEQKKIHKLLIDNKEITDTKDILK